MLSFLALCDVAHIIYCRLRAHTFLTPSYATGQSGLANAFYDTTHLFYALTQAFLAFRLVCNMRSTRNEEEEEGIDHSRALECCSTVLWQIFYLCSAQLMLQYVGTLVTFLGVTDDTHLPLAMYAIHISQLLVVGVTPRAPTLQVDMSDLYDKSVSHALNKLASSHTYNTEAAPISRHLNGEIAGVQSASIFAWLSMHWALPVIRSASRQSQIDLHELPVLEKNLRQQDLALEVFQQDAQDKGKEVLGGVDKVSSAGFMWKMWRLQGRAILTCKAPHSAGCNTVDPR